MQSATGSAAPIGDMMIVVGNAILGPGNGRTFMLIEAFTVFLALIGTTLSCMNTGARVTYAMGKDEEVPEHFGMLHSQEPDAASRHLDAGGHFRGGRLHRGVGAVRRCRRSDGCHSIKALPQGFFSSFGYMTTIRWRRCQHPADHDAGFQLRHVPAVHAELHHLHGGVSQSSERSASLQASGHSVFGLLANLACMAFYLVGPFMGYRHQDGTAAGAGDRGWSGRSTVASTSCAPVRPRRAARRWSSKRFGWRSSRVDEFSEVTE